MLRSFNDVLALWTPKQFSRVMGLRYTTAVQMYNRHAINSAHWSKLIEATKARGEVLTPEMLMRFREKQAAETRRRARLQQRRSRAKSDPQSSPVP